MNMLGKRFESEVSVPLIRARAEKQRIESLINEEALLLAKYLRGEIKSWVPRIPRNNSSSSEVAS
jgi:hypothetical protein